MKTHGKVPEKCHFSPFGLNSRVSGPCFRPVFQARVLGPRFRPASWATAVHCKSSPKSDLNTFEARLVYTKVSKLPSTEHKYDIWRHSLLT